MTTYKLTIAYDGTNYHGWQVQPGLITIQETLQDRLGRIFGHRVVIWGAGRTDAGVHAKGQVAHFHTAKMIELPVLHRALNAILPPDIAILTIEEVSSSFHAQYNAIGKEYRYYLLNQPVRSPFFQNYSLLVKYPLDFDKMQEALRYVIGTHDFYPLSVARPEMENTTRTITRAELGQDGYFWVFIFEGNGFLHKMVRIIVGTLLQIGRHRFDSQRIQEILANRDKGLAGSAASPRGLFLMSVKY